MAYVDFALGSSSLGMARTSAVVRPGPVLTELERGAVLLARNDTMASVGRTDGLAGLMRRALMLKRTNRLADPRLEALRSFAVVTARSGHEGDPAPLIALGYSEAQVAEARALSLRFRRPRTSRAQTVQVLVTAVASFVTYVLTRPIIGDPLVTAMVAACLNLTWVSLIRPRTTRP